uniref:CRAL-TRIO domain-containing protein n=1 Tax=Macrostomum lignano TaxID=282301 RepID=A0A1I8H8W6_9PLAT
MAEALSGDLPPEPMDDLSPEKQKLFLEFKDQAASLIVKGKFLHEDHFLKKWLIARNWDVSKAVAMFAESEKFKKEMDVDHLLDWEPPEVLKQYYCGGIIGHAKDGSPVKLAATNLDMKGLLMACRRQDVIKNRLRECELVVKELEAQTRRLGVWVDKMTIIFDQSHASQMLWGPARDINTYFAKMLESNYPEMLGKMFVVNAPAIFPLLWKLFRPFLAEETKNKIFVLGGDFQKLGPQGLKVPEELYLTEGLVGCDDAVEIEIGFNEKKTVGIDVQQPGSLLKYEFSTKGYDIAFGIDLVAPADACQNGAKTRRHVLPTARYNSHMAPEVGTLLCETAGLYELVFDNSFSWTRGKRLLYRAELLPPVQDAETSAEIDRMRSA